MPYEGMSALAYFGAKLRQFRERAGMSQTALGKELNYSDGLVGMVETARRSPSREFAMLADRVLKTQTDGVLELLWPIVHNQEFHDWYPEYVELERTATQMRCFAPQAIPGLLQTDAYARAIHIAAWSQDDDTINERVEHRLQRQSILDKRDGPTVWVVVDEAALLRPVGGPEVMREQLIRLRGIAASRRVVVQVLPIAVGAHAGMGGGVVLLAFDDSPTCAYFEGIMAGHIIDSPSAVRECERRYDHLRAAARTPQESLIMIDSLIQEGA